MHLCLDYISYRMVSLLATGKLLVYTNAREMICTFSHLIRIYEQRLWAGPIPDTGEPGQNLRTKLLVLSSFIAIHLKLKQCTKGNIRTIYSIQDREAT